MKVVVPGPVLTLSLNLAASLDNYTDATGADDLAQALATSLSIEVSFIDNIGVNDAQFNATISQSYAENTR